jgi:hypothetical protein
MLGKADLPAQPDIDAATSDLVAIIKGMIDAARQHGEDDQTKLATRVRCATFGYLDATCKAAKLSRRWGPSHSGV